MLFLPVAHPSFISVLVWVAMRLRLDAAPMGRGLVLGLELVSSIVVGLTIATILRSHRMKPFGRQPTRSGQRACRIGDR